MPTTDVDRAHEPLDQAECLRLLGTTRIGRLAYTRSALPVVRPVSFRLREGDVVIPARLGSPLLDAVRGAVVAFEADAYDDEGRTGWTVSVTGPSRVVQRAPDPVCPLECVIAVRITLVQGWRTTAPPVPAGS
ncbi:pyridoxamine 5'-phosphate oxidase family protein [Geodermatophilus sp. SYSU D00815]